MKKKKNEFNIGESSVYLWNQPYDEKITLVKKKKKSDHSQQNLQDDCSIHWRVLYSFAIIRPQGNQNMCLAMSIHVQLFSLRITLIW